MYNNNYVNYCFFLCVLHCFTHKNILIFYKKCVIITEKIKGGITINEFCIKKH